MNALITIAAIAGFIIGLLLALNYRRIPLGNPDRRKSGVLVLLIPMFGLPGIVRDGQFTLMVIPSSATLSVVCWIGWLGALTCGLLMVSGRWPKDA